MNELDLRLHELLGEEYVVEIEGCQRFGDDCGKKDDSGKFICDYCRRWKGQQREITRKKEPTIFDLHRFLNENGETWSQYKGFLLIENGKVNGERIIYNSSLSLLQQSDETKKAIIELITSHS